MLCRRLLVVFAVALLASTSALLLSPPAQAATSCPYACSWPTGARADTPLKLVRGALLVRKALTPDPVLKQKLGRAVEALDRALAEGWTSNGQVSPNEAGGRALANMRLAVIRLNYSGAALRSTTALERSGIVATMWYVSLGRFNRVWAAQGDRTVLWKAENQLRAADRDFQVNRVRASLRYWRVWTLLRGQPG